MSDQNPPEQGAFGSPPPPGSDPGFSGAGGTAGGPMPGGPASGGPASGGAASGGPTGGAGAPPPPPVSPGTPPPASSSPAPLPEHGHAPHGAGAYVASGGDAIVDSSAGFLPALFDFSFNSFVTPKIVRLVYVLAVIWAVVVYVFSVINGFFQSLGYGLFVLIVGPLVALIWIAVVRIGLEFGISVVRMSEDVHRRLPQA